MQRGPLRSPRQLRARQLWRFYLTRRQLSLQSAMLLRKRQNRPVEKLSTCALFLTALLPCTPGFSALKTPWRPSSTRSRKRTLHWRWESPSLVTETLEMVPNSTALSISLKIWTLWKPSSLSKMPVVATTCPKMSKEASTKPSGWAGSQTQSDQCSTLPMHLAMARISATTGTITLKDHLMATESRTKWGFFPLKTWISPLWKSTSIVTKWSR